MLEFFFVCVIDDSASAASSMEVTDRIASLEQRVQMQEDEIQLLKSALADVVRRLNTSEEQQAMLSRKGPTKGTRLDPLSPNLVESPRVSTLCCLFISALHFIIPDLLESVQCLL